MDQNEDKTQKGLFENPLWKTRLASSVNSRGSVRAAAGGDRMCSGRREGSFAVNTKASMSETAEADERLERCHIVTECVRKTVSASSSQIDLDWQEQICYGQRK